MSWLLLVPLLLPLSLSLLLLLLFKRGPCPVREQVSITINENTCELGDVQTTGMQKLICKRGYYYYLKEIQKRHLSRYVVM
ncbi:hypothetical protein T492DRAFT_991912 [Pavlovales sp. CCMP2436]|nr:hypothetical protein T492DRAFT_991912 [Pavlovales sp. CCMP2436]